MAGGWLAPLDLWLMDVNGSNTVAITHVFFLLFIAGLHPKVFFEFNPS